MESNPQPARLESEAQQTEQASVPAALCGNCGREAMGAFCHSCGQRFLGDRLSFRLLWDEFSRQFLHLERGFLVTLIDMFKSPGRTIQRYVRGGRRRYVNPFTFLLICSTASVLLTSLSQDRLLEFISQTYEGQDLPTIMTTARVERLLELQSGLFQYIAYIALAVCIPVAALMRLILGRSQDLRFAEAMVFSLYCFGLVSVLSLPNTLLIAMTDISVNQIALLSYGIYMATSGWAAWTFFDRSKSAMIATVVIVGFCYFLVTMVIGIGMFAFVMLTV